MDKNKFKNKILAACLSTLQKKKDVISSAMAEITESMTSETKSSVGDKHETGRAKMQIEQDQLQGQLNELDDQMTELQKINLNAPAETIFLGSLVKTNNKTFFIATALGKSVVDDEDIYVISPKSPIGQLLLGLKNHDTFGINGADYKILGIS